jgi:hypothetical protein
MGINLGFKGLRILCYVSDTKLDAENSHPDCSISCALPQTRGDVPLVCYSLFKLQNHYDFCKENTVQPTSRSYKVHFPNSNKTTNYMQQFLQFITLVF